MGNPNNNNNNNHKSAAAYNPSVRTLAAVVSRSYKQGFLQKSDAKGKNWKKRYC